MAKDKEFEKQYRLIGKKRANERRMLRNQQHWKNKHDLGMECLNCGGRMTWCSTCQVWSRTCCEEYGTCQCS